VGVGVVALLVLTGHIASGDFWAWYARWWPLLLIGAGLALLGEWALDMRRKTPIRRGGSFVGILILLAILGIGASGWHNFWGPFRAQFGDHDDDFFNSFGLPEHDNDQQVLNSQNRGRRAQYQCAVASSGLRQLGRRRQEDFRRRSAASDRQWQHCAGQV
jgi:hypothetical protein